VQWQRISEPFIWPFDGCKWSRFRAVVRSSAVRVAQAGGPYTIRAEQGKPSPALQLDGVGGAPTVRVRGPGGQVFEAPAGKGLVMSPDNTVRILRFDGQTAKMTIVGLQNARPGVYTVETLPGSPRVAGVKQATDPPDAAVTGRVTGKGRRRVLHYNVRPREGQTVIFEELTQKGASKRIGTTTKARGRIRFRSAPGVGRRRVVAQFELSGIPAERKTFTSFKPQSPRLAKPKRIRVRRSGSRVRVSWRKVKGATRYEVAANLSSRRMVFARTRRTRVTLRRVPRYVAGRITVRALDDLRQSGIARSKRFRATGRRPSPFRRLLDCRLRRRTITCAIPKQRCGGRAPTITAVRGRRTRGTRGNDVIIGTAGNDRIDGRGGHDVICAAGGNDRVRGGSGNDRITGRTGNDTIIGGTGDDRIKGGKNDDRLIAGTGDDRIIGGAGRGRDRIVSGPGDDRIETRDDGPRDRIDCGPGRDTYKADRLDRWAGCERVFIPRVGLVK
jgi:hypothetical protein